MRPARLGAAALLAGGALLSLAPPSVAASPSGAWTDPAPHTSHQDIPVAHLDRIRPLAGTASFEGGIAGVSFSLVDAPDPDDPCSAAEEVLPQSSSGGGSKVDFAFDAPFPCNRRYHVRVRVEPQQRPLRNDSVLVMNLLVDVAVPPAPTIGIVAEVSGRAVTVRWDPASQAPDFEGYQIQRATGGGQFTVVGEAPADATSFPDPAVPDAGGTLRYRVVGMRPGPESGTTVFGESADTAIADLPPAPSAEDEEAAEDDDGGGGSGEGAVRHGSGGTVRRTFRTPTATRRSTTATTIDTGYQETLPFDPGSAPAGDPAVVARIDDDDTEGQRQTLLLVAGGSSAFSWAMLLRFLSRRALVL